MIYIGYEKLTEVKALISHIHYKPELLSDEVKMRGILIQDEELIEPEQIEGKNATRYINPQTKEQWVEYVDRELTVEEQLKAENEELKNSLADLWEVLLFGGE